MKRAFGNKLLNEYRLFVILVIIIIALQAATHGLFLQKGNIINLFNQNAMLGIITIGQFLVILTGGIDLSVGTVMMMSSVIYVLYQDLGPLLSAIISILAGTLFGLINAVLITKLKINSFITTLGTMTIAEGVGYVLVDGHTIFSIEDSFLKLGQIRIFSVSLYVYIWIALTAVMIFILRYMTYGIKLYSAGGNVSATRLSGINTDAVVGSTYVISGFLCGLVGVMYTARLCVADPSVSGSFHTDSITAVVIAGTLMTGGKGKLSHVFIGVLILGMLSNFMNTLGVPTALHVRIKGIILILMVLLNIYQNEKA